MLLSMKFKGYYYTFTRFLLRELSAKGRIPRKWLRNIGNRLSKLNPVFAELYSSLVTLLNSKYFLKWKLSIGATEATCSHFFYIFSTLPHNPLRGIIWDAIFSSKLGIFNDWVIVASRENGNHLSSCAKALQQNITDKHLHKVAKRRKGTGRGV